MLHKVGHAMLPQMHFTLEHTLTHTYSLDAHVFVSQGIKVLLWDMLCTWLGINQVSVSAATHICIF